MSFNYLISRILSLFLVLIMAATIVFVLVRMTGDPVTFMVTDEAPPEQVKFLRESMGLNDPIPVQYVRFLQNAVTGNFGDSFRYLQPVTNLVANALPYTLALAGSAFFLSSLLALPTGIIAAVKRNSLFDRGLMLISMVGMSMPTFWFGIMLIFVFGVWLRILPTSGTGDIRNLVLPTLTLTAWSSARIARITRSSMLDVLGQDYLRTARGKGVSEQGVIVRHAIKNASIAVVTMLGIELGSMLGGAIITETVFTWPGLGRLALNAIWVRDYPLVQGTVLYAAFLYAVINMLVDLLYGFLDPRISQARGG